QQESEDDRSVVEYEARQQTIARAQERNDLSTRDGQRIGDEASPGESGLLITKEDASDMTSLASVLARSEGGGGGAQGEGSVTQGAFTPVWRVNPTSGEAELLFVRVVTVSGRELLQGFWVDWPALRADLLASVRDLLPEADLEPVGGLMSSRLTGGQVAAPSGGLASAGRLLASVPAVLAPGVSAQPALSGLTPTRIVLVVAWLAVVAAVVAIGLVLRASLALSDRRGRFVSAVTHELRTPLTTFCLYSQMLADGMVQGEDRRREYLSTLKRESERLATIVENVLIYARTGNRVSAAEPRPVGALLDAVVPLLEQRTGAAGMGLEVDAELARPLSVAADAASLDRVLGNLVDNACKYASEAGDRRVTLRVREAGNGVEFRVRDRGPGVAPRERRRIFSPFTRARTHAADGSSGLGLGLALARTVARSLGGDLRLAVPAEPGAEFVLWLPAAEAGAEAGGGSSSNPPADRG
ncbi:MAG: sensor histidine kinase, partial [Phycisphaerales bacterium JB041]